MGHSSGFTGRSCTFEPNWAKNVQFSKCSNHSNQTNYMMFAHDQKVSLFFWGGSLKRFSGKISQKRAIFEIFKPFKSNQIYAYGLWCLPTHAQKVSMIFWGGSLKRFSGSKPHFLTQIGPKTCNFQTLQIKPTICQWCLPMPKKFP